MSEESKQPDSDYVHMGDGVVPRGTVALPGLDDPNLSQEDRDMRLALALQQQENAAVYEQHKQKHEAAVAANSMRTARSGAQGRLAQIRKKDHGMLSVPAEYSTENAYISGGDVGDYTVPGAELKGAPPQVVADHNLAAEMQKLEQTAVGTGQTLEKIISEEKEDEEEQKHRVGRTAHMRGFA